MLSEVGLTGSMPWDWKYDDQGFHYFVLSEFRYRLVQGQAEYLLVEAMIKQFLDRELLKGCPLQAIVATFCLDERTIMDWQDLAGRHF